MQGVQPEVGADHAGGDKGNLDPGKLLRELRAEGSGKRVQEVLGARVGRPSLSPGNSSQHG